MLEYVFTLSPVLLALMAGIITWLFTLLGAGLVVFFKNINKKTSFRKRGLLYTLVVSYEKRNAAFPILKNVFAVEAFFIEYSALAVNKNGDKRRLLQFFVNFLAYLLLTFAQVAEIVGIFKL